MTKKREITKNRILHAAKKLLEEKPEKVTAEHIALEAKVSRATFFNYFKSFSLLYSEIAAEEVKHILQYSRAKMRNAKEDEKIFAITDTFVDECFFAFKLVKKVLFAHSHENKQLFKIAREIEKVAKVTPLQGQIVLGTIYGVLFLEKPKDDPESVKKILKKQILELL